MNFRVVQELEANKAVWNNIKIEMNIICILMANINSNHIIKFSVVRICSLCLLQAVIISVQ